MIAPRRRPSSMAHVVDMEDLTVGTAGWVERTSGRLTTAERRALPRPLARPCGQIAVGRLRLALGVHRAATPIYLTSASRRPPVC